MPRIVTSGLICVAGLGLLGCGPLNAALEDALGDLDFRLETPELETTVSQTQEVVTVGQEVTDPVTNITTIEEVELEAVVVEVEAAAVVETPVIEQPESPDEEPVLQSITVDNVVVPVVPVEATPEDPNLAGTFTVENSDDEFAEVYRFIQASEGSYAISSYNPEDTFTEFSGGVIVGATDAPTSGQASFEGEYIGDLPARDEVLGVTGTVNLDANFDANTFTATISDRDFTGSNADDRDDLDDFVNVDQVLGDMTFSGNIDALGSMQGDSDTANVSGEMQATAYDGGVIGIVAVNHENAVRSELLPDPLESGVFDATETP